MNRLLVDKRINMYLFFKVMRHIKQKKQSSFILSYRNKYDRS
jgi:hypothetical protein